MHIAFVDESGDVGLRNSPTRHFVLCAAVVDHVHWAAVNAELQAMRARLLAAHGLRPDAEIHASEFLSKQPLHLGLDNRARFVCVRHMLKTFERLPGIRYVRTAIAKPAESGLTLAAAWSNLLAGIEQTLIVLPKQPCQSTGLVIVCDHHAARPYRPAVLTTSDRQTAVRLLDWPYGRDSSDNLILQMVDLLAYLTKQSLEPNGYFSKTNGRALVRLSDALFAAPCPVTSS